VSVETKFLLRKSTGDQLISAETELRDILFKGQCQPSDFLYEFLPGRWWRVGDHPAVGDLFTEKPKQNPERRVIYFVSPDLGSALPQGPFSTGEFQVRAENREICALTWVFVEGDKEWRQVKQVKILYDLLPGFPEDVPQVPAPDSSAKPLASAAKPTPVVAAPTGRTVTFPEQENPSNPSIQIELGSGKFEAKKMGGADAPTSPTLVPPAAPLGMPHLPARPPSIPPRAVTAPTLSLADREAAMLRSKAMDTDSFDGIVAQISMEPIWLIKRANSETVSGPFRFLEVVEFLSQGKLTKSDKISRTGTKAFVKIQQQYEFNVKYSIETVKENGQEKQKIMIRRRHPRVPYITGVQIVSKHGLLVGQCVNISAGGILMEVPKAEFNLGEIIEVKIMPGPIAKSISCRSLVIGKIPKIPPAYAMKFEDLRLDDKEAIETYVQETLKREMSKKT
jgi:hypothetical protein